MDKINSDISGHEAGKPGDGLCLLAFAGDNKQSLAKPVEVKSDAPAKDSLPAGRPLTAAENTMLEKIEREHFQYFKQESDPVTGLTLDRSSKTSPASIAATGFSLTAYGVAVNRGWISRDEAADNAIKVLKTLATTAQGDAPEGMSGRNGLFYHFLDPHTGTRAGNCEVSTIDTALLMAGVLFSKDFFNQDNSKETEIRNLADQLYRRVDWQSAMAADGKVSMGWTPESGMIATEWKGLNEGQILMLMGMGSPTHPLPDGAWNDYMSSAKIGSHNGEKSIEFGPLFGHQYMQIWMDIRGLEDATNKQLGFDYFENSRRAVQAQHNYALDNPQGCRGYGSLDWGLSASDGPGYVSKMAGGRDRQFIGYGARGFPGAQDDCTITPTAAAASLPFAPEIVLPTLKHWLQDRPELDGPLGFSDAFNPTFDSTTPSGWVDPDRLGIDQGPTLLMTENYRSAFVWNTMRNDPYLQSALSKAGFSPVVPAAEK